MLVCLNTCQCEFKQFPIIDKVRKYIFAFTLYKLLPKRLLSYNPKGKPDRVL